MVFLWQNTEKIRADIRCPLEYGLWWQMEIPRIICVLSASKKLRYSEIRKKMYVSQTQFADNVKRSHSRWYC